MDPTSRLATSTSGMPLGPPSSSSMMPSSTMGPPGLAHTEAMIMAGQSGHQMPDGHTRLMPDAGMHHDHMSMMNDGQLADQTPMPSGISEPGMQIIVLILRVNFPKISLESQNLFFKR